MEKRMMEIVNVMHDNPSHMYDYIAQHYHEFTKSELADIIKELVYSAKYNLLKPEYNMVLGEAGNELKEQYGD